MKRYILLLVVMMPTAVFAAGEGAPLQGKALHDAKCMACHGTEVYSKADRKIQSLQELTDRVEFCMKNAVKEHWTDAQVQSVANYLDKTFYKF